MDKISVIILMLIIVAGLLVIDIERIKSESGKCLLNPLVYGVNSWSEKNHNDLTCRCYFNLPDTPEIFITRTNLTIK